MSSGRMTTLSRCYTTTNKILQMKRSASSSSSVSLSASFSSISSNNSNINSNINIKKNHWKQNHLNVHPYPSLLLNAASSQNQSQYHRHLSSSAATTNDDIHNYNNNTNTNTNNNNNSNNNKKHPKKNKKTKSILSDDKYDPITTCKNIYKAAQWNQGSRDSNAKWDPQFVSKSVDSYIDHLMYIQHYMNKKSADSSSSSSNSGTANSANNSTSTSSSDNGSSKLPHDAKEVLSSNTTERALKAMLKMKIPTHTLSTKIRYTEKLIGSIGHTPLTNNLSLRLIEANGKSGNIGRTLSLLNLRKVRKFTPTITEYNFAIQSIISAGLYLRTKRNIYANEFHQPQIDNPTRWLDAILENMSERGVPLDTNLANRMIDCYACTGRSGKALHFFYKVTQTEVIDDDDIDDIDDDDMDDMDVDIDDMDDDMDDKDVHVKNRKTKIRMKMRQRLPPFYKIPSDVKLHNEMVKRPRKDGLVSKLEWEKEKAWSPSLAASFAFAESLTHGACGHEPIELDIGSWNTLIKVCCYRGAIFRALEILNDTMPSKGIEPDVITYNTILAALARVGDKDFMREMLTTMTNKGVGCNKYTVKALVDGYLNAGDISGAVTLVQDMFNQQHLLPPYTTHLKIIEFALGNDLIYEAKRHVYFIQQLWKWKPREVKGNKGGHASDYGYGYGQDSKSFQNLMYATQKNPKISKKSLQGLFSYFGEELLEEDFF